MNDMVPTAILCDIIQSSSDAIPQCTVDEAKDFGAMLTSHKKAVLFAGQVQWLEVEPRGIRCEVRAPLVETRLA